MMLREERKRNFLLLLFSLFLYLEVSASQREKERPPPVKLLCFYDDTYVCNMINNASVLAVCEKGKRGNLNSRNSTK